MFGVVGEVPTIDLQETLEQKLNEKIRDASEKWGSFRIKNHGVPLTLMAEMKKVMRSLLDLPEKIKRRNTDVIQGSGYWAPNPINPLYEALGLYDMASSQAVNTFCDQLSASPGQRETIEKYAKAIQGLAVDLAKKLARSFRVRSDFFEEWSCQCRINKYNFKPENIGTQGVQIHTDSGFLTILQDDENVSGLEVMDGSGNFISADPLPGTLFVNLGDMAAIWSNGRLCNVKHRVQCREGAVRVSIATFLLGPKEEAVESPPELVDAEHPRLYVPVTYEEYRKLRLSMELRSGEALELIHAEDGLK